MPSTSSAQGDQHGLEGEQERRNATKVALDKLRRLRSAKTPRIDRDRIVDEILASGSYPSVLLFNQLRNDFVRLESAWRRSRAAHLKQLARVAPKILRQVQGKGAAKEIETLRTKQLRLSRTRGLTKAQVRKLADGYQNRLIDLCEITFATARKHSKELRQSDERLGQQLDRLFELEQQLARARRALTRDERGRKHLAKQKPLAKLDRVVLELERDRDWICTLATPMSKRDRKVLEQNHALAAQIPADEYEGVLQHNRLRIRSGLNALRLDVKLCKAARDHSKDMVEHRFFSHSSPLPGKRTVGDRARLAGTSGGGENIAAGQRTPRGALRAWWYSPGHHRNMMGRYGRVGLGRHGSHWTQMFGR